MEIKELYKCRKIAEEYCCEINHLTCPLDEDFHYEAKEFLDNLEALPTDEGEISDGYHTFNELYYYRMLYNAAFFNSINGKYSVHKSKKHSDGEPCFGGGWFIVMANLPTGQISNHYKMKYWDLFHIPELDKALEWDGHTPQEAAERLYKFINNEYKTESNNC